MFLTTQTAKEVCQKLDPIYQKLTGSWASKLKNQQSRFLKLLKKSKNGCISLKETCHTTFDTIRVHLLPVGLYRVKSPKLVTRIESNSYWLFFMARDTKSGAHVGYLVRPRDLFVARLEAHALSRYRERCLNDPNLPYDETMLQLTARNTLFLHIVSLKTYGTSEDKFLESSRCVDGVFLGYYDSITDTHVFTTFILPEQLNNDQYYHTANDEQVKQLLQSDDALKHIPDAIIPAGEYKLVTTELVEDKKVLRPLTEEEAEAYRNQESDEDDYESRKIRENNIKQRWTRKMFRKGYK